MYVQNVDCVNAYAVIPIHHYLILMSAAASAAASADAAAVAKSNVSILQRFISMYDHLAHPWRAPALVYSLITF